MTTDEFVNAMKTDPEYIKVIVKERFDTFMTQIRSEYPNCWIDCRSYEGKSSLELTVNVMEKE